MKSVSIISSCMMVFAAAQVQAQHFVEYGVNLSLGPTHYIQHYEQGPLPVGPIIEEDIIPGYGRVAGVANVGFGVNKARVDLAGTHADNPLYFEYGFATSQYFDVFQFDDPELDGTHGFFDVTLYVAGSGFVNMDNGYLQSPDTEFYSFWHAVINVSVDGVLDPNGSTVQSVYYAGEWYKGFDSTTLDYYGDPLNTYQQTATIEFIYGQPILMDTFLQVDTHFDNQWSSVAGTLDAVIDLGNSTYWGGIRNLRNSQGVPVNPAGYSSSSGFDYRQSALSGSSLPPTVASAPHDRSKNRYVSFAPDNPGANVAFRIDKTTAPSGSCWVDAPDTLGNAKCVAAPVFRVWTEPVIHVGDCEIVPVASYSVRSTADNVAFSTALTVNTTPLPTLNNKFWGDVAGTNNGLEWTPPNQFANVQDVLAALSYITNAAIRPTFQMVNLQSISTTDPCLNAFVNTADVLILVKAVGGDAYPFVSNPANCPACP